MFDQARADLKAYIIAHWTQTPLAWEDEAFDPPKQRPWIRVEIDAVPASDSSVFGSVGKRVVQDPGIIIATLYMPNGGDTARGYALTKLFGDMLRVLKIGAAQTGAPSTSPVEDGDDEGRWDRFAVTVPFTTSYFA